MIRMSDKPTTDNERMIFNGGVFVRRYLFAIPIYCIYFFSCCWCCCLPCLLTSLCTGTTDGETDRQGALLSIRKYVWTRSHHKLLIVFLAAAAAPQMNSPTIAGRRTHSRRFDRPQQSHSMYSASCVQCQSDPGGAKNKRWARLNHDFDVVLDSPFLAFLLLFFYFFSISSLYRVGDHLRGLGFF